MPALANRRSQLVPTKAAADKDAAPTPTPGLLLPSSARALDVLSGWAALEQKNTSRERIGRMTVAISAGNFSHIYAITDAAAPSAANGQDANDKINEVPNPDATATASMAAPGTAGALIRAIAIVKDKCVGGKCRLDLHCIASRPPGSAHDHNDLLRALNAWALRSDLLLMLHLPRNDAFYESLGFLPLGGRFAGAYVAVPTGHAPTDSLVELAADDTSLAV